MDVSVTAVAIALAAASALLFVFLRKWNGDVYPPVVGTVFSHILNFDRLHDYNVQHARRYPTFRVVYPTFSDVFTTHPPNVEHILKTNFSNYVKGKFNYDIMRDLLGDGIFSVDGDKWRQQRKIASFEFSAKVLRDFSSVVFRDTAIRLANILSEAARTNQILEMQNLLMRATLDGICRVAFGVDVNSLSGSESGPDPSFGKAFDTSNAIVFWRYVDGFWRLKRFLNIGAEAVMRKSVRTVDNFVYKVIQSRRQEISAQKHQVNVQNSSYSRIDVPDLHISAIGQDPGYKFLQARPDILSRYLALAEKEPEIFSDKYLRDVILNFMLAGRDTTALTLCWFLHLLSKNPPVQENLVREICNVVEENKSESPTEDMSTFARSLTHSVLDKMHYLHASLSETLRLYPPVPLDAKCVVCDDILPDGFKVKAGDSVSYVPYAMGRMTYLWGSDAEEFRPERWLQDGIFQPQSPFKFTAFQAGPRICVGKDFAYMQMKIVAAVLIRFFKFEAVGGKEVKYRPSLTLHLNDDGLNLRISRRSDL